MRNREKSLFLNLFFLTSVMTIGYEIIKNDNEGGVFLKEIKALMDFEEINKNLVPVQGIYKIECTGNKKYI